MWKQTSFAHRCSQRVCVRSFLPSAACSLFQQACSVTCLASSASWSWAHWGLSWPVPFFSPAIPGFLPASVSPWERPSASAAPVAKATYWAPQHRARLAPLLPGTSSAVPSEPPPVTSSQAPLRILWATISWVPSPALLQPVLPRWPSSCYPAYHTTLKVNVPRVDPSQDISLCYAAKKSAFSWASGISPPAIGARSLFWFLF